MLPLTDLIIQDSMLATWLPVREVPIGDNRAYQLWNVVITRTVDVSGAPANRDVFIMGIAGDPADAARHHDGIPNKPDAMRVLAELLTTTRDVDDYPKFPDWMLKTRGIGMDDTITPARVLQIQREFGRDCARCDTLRGWLGDDYQAYVTAAAQYLADH